MSRRAGELVRKIEEREFQAAMLAPKRVRLRVADLPVVEAVAELAKASGYAIHVDGFPTDSGKKVTLDTGDVTFWEAFDKVCTQAGLIEKMRAANAKSRNRVAYGKELSALTLLPGMPKNEHLNYMATVRFRLYALPKEKSPDYRMMLEAAAEPRLDGFALVGAPTIKRSVDEQGRDIVFNKEAKVEKAVQDPALAPKPGFAAGGYEGRGGPVAERQRQYAILHFKPGKQSSRALAELRGSYTAQIKTPEEVLTVDKVLESAGKTYICKYGEVLRVDEIQVVRPGRYSAQFTWTEPLSQLDEVPKGRAALDGDPVPELFDSKGNKLDRLPGKMSLRIAKGTVIHMATVIFQSDAGQGEPARLVLIDMRTTHVDVPFAFQNVPLE